MDHTLDTQPALYVDLDPCADFLVDADGHPVWPVRTAREKRALEELAQTFSIEIRPTRGIPLRDDDGRGPRPVPAAGWVAVVGRDLAQEGALYAHLTARGLARFEDTEALVGAEVTPDVVVALSKDVSAELLEAMHSWSRSGRTAGLILSLDVRAMRAQVLCKAAFARVPGWARRNRVEVWPYRRSGTDQLPDGLAVGRESRADEVRGVLGAGAGVLAISTHSDGFDAPLGERLILCTLQHPSSASRVLERGPRCAMRGECHRLDLPLPEAAASASLVGPHEVSARVVVMLACSVVLSRESPTDEGWSLGVALATSPRIGALLAPHGVNVTHATIGHALVDDLAAGVCVGESLTSFNRSELAQLFDMRLVLLGDPGVRAVPLRAEAERKALPRVVLRPMPRAALTTEDLAEAHVLRHLALWARSAIHGEALDRSAALLAAIERYEHGYWSRHSSDAVFRAESELRESLFRYLIARGWRWTHDLQDMSDLSFVSEQDDRCGCCGARLLVLRGRLPLASAREREVRTCRACGLFEDTPVDFELRLERVDGITIARGEPEAERFSAGIAIWSQMERESRLHPWDGEWAVKNPIPIPSELPAGPLRIGVLWARKTQFAVASFVLAANGVA